MAAYVIVDIEVQSPEMYEEYKRMAPDSISAKAIRQSCAETQMVLVEGAPVLAKR